MSSIKHLKEEDKRGEIHLLSKDKNNNLETGGAEDLGVTQVSYDFKKDYQKVGKPDYFNYKFLRNKLDCLNETHVENDAYLDKYENIPFYAKSIKNCAEKYKNWEKVSAYNKDTREYSEYVSLHRPKHSRTKGGKGLAFYTKPIVTHHAGMGFINNFNITFGCPGSCSFCFPYDSETNFVKLKDGTTKKLVDVKVGEEIESYSKGMFTRVTSFTPKGERKVTRYYMDGGEFIEKTPDHPVLTKKDNKFQIRPIQEVFDLNLHLIKIL